MEVETTDATKKLGTTIGGNKMYRVSRFYDLQCCDCGRWYSTDFLHGMEMSKEALEKKATLEGWGYKKGKGNLCPVCNRKMGLQEFMLRYSH